jgi:predicted RNA binding protein with dsRBD fold (UPF0201 family)
VTDIKVVVAVDIHPTEDVDKVKQAVENFFPHASLETKPRGTTSLLVAMTEGKNGLTHLRARLRQERIVHAARRIFRRGLQRHSFTFYLNKQVAYANRTSFCEPHGESPLGSIKVVVACNDPRDVIAWLTAESAMTGLPP